MCSTGAAYAGAAAETGIASSAATKIVPARLQAAATIHKMPEYAALVKGSRTIAGRKQPMRTIRTEFPLHPTTDPTFLYLILGGRLEPGSPWIGIITVDGQVRYEQIGK